MSQRTVAATIIEMLAAAQIRRIYGIVGDSLNGIVDEVRRHPAIEWVGVRHEETGAFAAGAEAQLSGRLAVCAGSSGPGNLHLINGLYDCHRSLAPVLAIAAHVPRSEIGTHFFQETHPDRIFQECSHYCELISSGHQAPQVMRIAMQTAMSLNGVAVIIVPGDAALDPVPEIASAEPSFIGRPIVRPTDQDVARLADLLNSSRRVSLLCGIGCAGAHEELLAVSERLAAPIVHSLRGKSCVEYDNPFDVGMTGLIGLSSGHRALADCDALLMLGTDFPYRDWYPHRAKVAQVDIRPEHLSRRCRLDLGLVGNVKHTLQLLLPMLHFKADRRHLDDALQHYRKVRESLQTHVKGFADQRPIRPEFLTAVLDELAADDAILTVDTGMCTVWAARYLRMSRDRRLLGSFSHGSMANALPQAIGAQCLYPDRQVISLSGDGGFTMLMGDFLTLSQHGLPVKTIVYNNGSLGMVKLEMHVAGLPDHGTHLVNPNFAEMARAMGVEGIRVENPAEVRPAIKRALDHPGPVLVDVVTDSNALALPPKVSLQQAWGFSLALLKEMLGARADDTLKA